MLEVSHSGSPTGDTVHWPQRSQIIVASQNCAPPGRLTEFDNRPAWTLHSQVHTTRQQFMISKIVTRSLKYSTVLSDVRNRGMLAVLMKRTIAERGNDWRSPSAYP